MEPVMLAGARLDHYHACAFFDSRDEEYQVLGSYIRDGIRAGEKAVHICDPKLCDDHRRRLEGLGVPVADCERAGQLEVVSWEHAYLKGGRFDQETMLALVEEVVKTAKAEGFPRVRIMGHMEWALERPPGVEQMQEYEARVNDVLNRLQQPAVCVFDLSRFSGTEVMEILRMHRFVVFGGVMRENPFYAPPAAVT